MENVKNIESKNRERERKGKGYSLSAWLSGKEKRRRKEAANSFDR